MSPSTRSREPRKKHSRPVKVRAVDEASRFFLERTETVDISPVGARVVLRHPVGPDGQVYLSDIESERSGVFVVVWQRPEGQCYHCGLVLADPGQPVWPRLDEMSLSSDRIDLHCGDCGAADHILVAVREVSLLRDGRGLSLPCDHCGKETTWAPAAVARAAAATAGAPPATMPMPVKAPDRSSPVEIPRASRQLEGVSEIEFFRKRPPPETARTEQLTAEVADALARLESTQGELRTAQEAMANLERTLDETRKESSRLARVEIDKERLEEKLEKFQERLQAREAELKEISRERDQARKKAESSDELADRCEALKEQLRARDAELKTARRLQDQLHKLAEAGAISAMRRAELEQLRDKLDAEVAELRAKLKAIETEPPAQTKGRAAADGAARPHVEIAEHLARAISLLTVARAEAGLLSYAECDPNTRESVEQINHSLAELAKILAQWRTLPLRE